jgi:methionine-rich copper-binding protein CopC
MPADGSTVKSSPEHIMLTFSEPARLTALTIQKDGGEEQKLAPLPSDASDHVMVTAPKLAPGKYTVSYRVVSDDNHVMSGKLHFSVAEETAASATAAHDHAN